uniref:Nuclear cap-binding protein subunit 3 n=3 Tax=Caenorhabditis japonica TaxID=281687 RepID=A0A8R1E436_CAEJA
MDDELDYESDHSVRGKDDGRDDEDSEQPQDELDVLIDQKEEMATMEAFGLHQQSDKHLCVSVEETRALRKELGVNETFRLDAVYVHGVQSMNEYAIQKTFSDFRAKHVWKKDNVAIVQFEYPQEAAAMMLNMSKMMRRVRSRKIADEDGEVASDDDNVEDGQILQEKGDDVELVEGLQANEKGIVASEKKSDFVTIDMGSRDIPFGKWRVLTKHVPTDMFVIVRYPTKKEFYDIKPEDEKEHHSNTAERDFWTVNAPSNRGGLNLFDKDGKELEWDYEHDTRFYDEEEEEKKKEAEKPKLPAGIKVRGRGAVKCGFLFGEGSSQLAADEESPSKKRRVEGDKKDYERDDVVARMGTAAHAIRPGRIERPMKDRIRFPDGKHF